MEALFLIAPLLLFLLLSLYQDKQYKSTAYYQITKNAYSSIKYDKGKYGEYLTYKHLQHLERNGGKFLFNIYIPGTNDKMSEIDVLLICSKGLFVFESKNYSGWIFGDEIQKNWMQIFPRGRGHSHKERFYNPIMQNAAHIKHLKRFMGENLPTRSIIVFSDKCTFKDLTIRSSDVNIITHRNILSVVTKLCDQTKADLLTQIEINNIYNKLYPYTQVSWAAKEQHKNNIQRY